MAQRWSRFSLGASLAAAMWAAGGVQAQGISIATWPQALELLRRHQPELDAAKAAVRAAEAGVDAAAASRLPRFEAGAGAEYSLIRPVYGADLSLARHQFLAADGLVPRGRAGVALELSLRAWSALRTAEAGLAAAEAEREAKASALRRQLAAAVLAVVAARQIEQRAGSGLEAARERRELVRRLQALGRATQLDELRFVDDVHDAEASVIEARRALAVARAALGDALGVDAAVDVALAFDAASVRAGIVAGECTRIASLSERPEVAAARLRVEEARRAATTAEYGALPELRVQTSYVATYRPNSAVTLEGERQLLHDWTAGVDLVWSIWDGGLRGAELSQRRAVAEERLAAEASSVRRATRLAALAEQNATLAADQLQLAEQRYEVARSADALTRRAYELGNASALESVEVAGRLRRASIEVVLRQIELLDAEAAQRLWWASCR